MFFLKTNYILIICRCSSIILRNLDEIFIQINEMSNTFIYKFLFLTLHNLLVHLMNIYLTSL